MDDTELIEKIHQLPPEKKKEVEDLINTILASSDLFAKTVQRKAGFAKGTFTILPGFDDTIDGLEDYM